MLRLVVLLVGAGLLGLVAAGVRFALDEGPGPTAGRLGRAPEVARYEGADRYSTSAAAALAVHDRASSAVLASGEGHADALVAQALAGATDGGAPFLLTDPRRLPPVTAAALRRLGVRAAVVVGDPTAVSSDVERSLEQAGVTVSRLEGPLRADTALAVARALRPRTVLLADGEDSTAVSVGPIAYRSGWPVLYSSSRGVSPAVLDLLADGDVEVHLVGTGERRDVVREQLRSAGVAVQPLVDGPVSGAPLHAAEALGWGRSRLTLVTAGPDALSAAQVAARTDAPMVVTGTPGALSSGAVSVLQDWPAAVERLLVVGDETTVTPGVLGEVLQALGDR